MEPMYWLIALGVLLLIEIITLGLTTIWFAGGALAAFVSAMLGANFFIQFVLFIVVSLVLLFSIKPYAQKYFNSKRVKTNYQSLIGQEARVTAEIDNFNQKGEANVNGQDWTARAVNDKIIPAGTRVKIVNVSGVKLIVTDQKEEI